MSLFKPEEVRTALIDKYGSKLIEEAEAIDKEEVERSIRDVAMIYKSETLDPLVEEARKFITGTVWTTLIFRLSAEQIESLKQIAIKYPTASMSPCEGGTPELIIDVIKNWCVSNDVYPEKILGELY
jgi:hypothetical protein